MHANVMLAGIVWCVASLLLIGDGDAADWLRFRGPNGSGIAEATLPLRWDDETRENIAWRVELPGRGLSSPIVVGDRVFLTCCSGYRQDRLHLICLDAHRGEVRWERQLWATGRTMTHPSISTAASTPASDGERIFAYYSTNDVACFDLDGELLWLRGLMLQFPNASNSLGLASSPVVLGDTVVIPVENETQSMAFGLDSSTGVTKWRLDRPEAGNWTTPIVIPGVGEDRPLVALQSGSMFSVHDPFSGDEQWRFEQGCATIPSSVVEGNVVFVPSDGLTALRYTRGAAELLWSNNRLGPSTATPVVHGGKVYSVTGSILKSADAATGRVESQLRLQGSFSSSPIVAGGHIYLFNEEGLGHVIELGRRLAVVAESDLAESVLCTPAVANNALYVRSDRHLWKITNTDP